MPKKPAEACVRVSARGAARLQARHPWVYRSDILEQNDVPPGAVVRVLDPRGKFLGTALYSSSSQIAIRMISHTSVADLPALVTRRIREALAYRHGLVANTNAYRIVFSEADFLPGLIVDRYNDILILQILTQAMDAAPVREAILQSLSNANVGAAAPGCPDEQSSAVPATSRDLIPASASIVERTDPRIRELEQLPPRPSALLQGEKTSTIITMNGDQSTGVRLHYDALEGQKTGAFLDQRENYAAAAQYACGEALDVFCYQGGFALHLARSCSSVTGVDSSRPALEMA